MITEALQKLLLGQTLSVMEADAAMTEICLTEVNPAQVGAFLIAVSMQTPKSEVMTGFVQALRREAVSVQLPPRQTELLLDVCGTGGDLQGSFNVSTCVAFVVASGGVECAKHGNRAVSSQSGSFDVLEALGVAFAVNSLEVRTQLQKFGLSFMFAPAFHPVLKKLAVLRKALGVRTILNALGPLLNPAQVGRQLIGVYRRDLMVPIAEVLKNLGVKEAMIVHSEDGADEISVCAPTHVVHLKNSEITLGKISPVEFGIQSANLKDIQGGAAPENAGIMLDIFRGQRGAKRDIVLLNSAAAFLVAGLVESLHEGFALAARLIDTGKPLSLLMDMSTNQTTDLRIAAK